MSKSYITKGHIIAELIAFLLELSSLGIAIFGAITIDHDILVRIGSDAESSYGPPSSLLSLPGGLLVTGIVISLTAHLLPVKYWSMPFTPKPGRENQILTDGVSLIITIRMIMAIFSLGGTILMYMEKPGQLVVASFVMVFFMFAAIIFWFFKMCTHNK